MYNSEQPAVCRLFFTIKEMEKCNMRKRKSVIVWYLTAVLLCSALLGALFCHFYSNTQKNAVAAYTELLKAGKTEYGLPIHYYAYVDLERDGVPELLVSDQAGTTQGWSNGELYGYDKGLVCYGRSSAYYAPFYLVNNKYLLMQHRMGAQYFSKDETIITLAYKELPDGLGTMPAVQINGDWSYVTDEEYAYYNATPEEGTQKMDSFMESVAPIQLIPNASAAYNQKESQDIHYIVALSERNSLV